MKKLNYQTNAHLRIGLFITGLFSALFLARLPSQLISLLGRYTGLHLLLALVSILIFAVISRKNLKQDPQPMLPAFIVQAAHLLWTVMSMFISGLYGTLIDIFFLLIGLTWLIEKPGIRPVIFLSTYHLLGLVFDVVFLLLNMKLSMEICSLVFLHIALRIFAMIFMMTGLRSLKLASQ